MAARASGVENAGGAGAGTPKNLGAVVLAPTTWNFARAAEPNAEYHPDQAPLQSASADTTARKLWPAIIVASLALCLATLMSLLA